MRVVVLAIGDELVLGQTVDSNSAWLSARLARLGIATAYHQTVPDDRAAIAHAIARAADAAEVVLVSGGLGPTADDLTREALADALGQPLEQDDEALAAIEALFARLGRPMPERNRVQALRPAGTQIIPNTCGTAPGIIATLEQATLYCAPGVPRELFAMFERDIEPRLADAAGGRSAILTATLHSFGSGESDVAARLGELMDRDRNPTVGTTVSDGIVSIRLRSEAPDSKAAAAAREQTAHGVIDRLGPLVYGRDGQTLGGAVIDLARARGITLATAESCTGGLIGAMLTDVPGSSDVYAGGWVTYSNAMKQQQLGVGPALLQQHGAVSEPVVRAMAAGALRHSDADLAVSVSGVAGPGGGTPDKPVGTVWIGMAHRRNGGPPDTDARLARLPGDRDAVRDRAAKCALQWIRLHLLGEDTAHLRWLAEPAAAR